MIEKEDGYEYAWCDKAHVEQAVINYEGEDLCLECFIKEVENETTFSCKVTHYFIDGEDVGSDDDEWNVIETFAKKFNATVIED